MIDIFYSYIIILIQYISIIWSIILILLSFVGLQLYKITNREKVIIIMKKISKRAAILDDNKQIGWVFGWPYISYITEVENDYGSNYNVYIYTTKKYYQNIFNSNDNQDISDNDKVEKQSVNIYERSGNYNYIFYAQRNITINDYIPKKNQTKPITEIKKLYQRKKFLVALIYGKPGCGKSITSLLLAKELNASICDTFNPTDPGDNITSIYNQASPTMDNPLIIIFEEFDIMISNIHHNKIISHKNMPIQIKNKTDYNKFMDRIDRGLYPHLILILTSNKDPNFIENLDPSYIRKGRVDLRIKMD
ncbi:hypothetical protein [Acanthamoeba polyphaga mimivirus]|uniref:ATPase AAA-type core domain-containing protein n=1 Tax=Acanthamoeba polyphaga mimivirus TaxID=212035 RepID=A0A2L2DI40_MIMIV|nr:hypothetical protein [Acanthamoeba polyphaga mimivirus]